MQSPHTQGGVGGAGEKLLPGFPLSLGTFLALWNFKIHLAFSEAFVSCRCFFCMESHCYHPVSNLQY